MNSTDVSKIPTDQLERSLKVRRRNKPYEFYIPNGKCEDFIGMVGEDKTFVSFFSAANGVGKTATGVNIIAHIIWGAESDNPFFDLPLFRKWPYPVRHGRIVSDPATIQDTLIPELHKWFPEGRYKVDKRGKNYEYRWTTDNGWVIEIMTYEQAVKEFESATLSFVWFDEPPPRAIYKACVARMRRGGIMFITATPLTGSAWMYDAIVAYDEEKDKKGDDFIKGQRDFMYADVEDACIQHGVRGILEHSDIEKMLAEYDEDEMQARAHGRFLHLTGLIFKNFNRKIHVIEPFTITERDYIVIEAMDPHPRNPDAVSWIAVDKLGRKIICNELYVNGSTPALAAKVKKIAADYRIEARLIDPSAFNEDQHQNDPEKATLAAQLFDLGLEYQRATKDRVRSDRRIKDAFDYEQDPAGGFIMAPEAYVFSTCTRHIWEFEHYQWDEWRGTAAERKDPKEKPMDKDDHMIENTGRILVQEPVWRPMPRQTQRSSNIGTRTRKQFDPFD